MQTAPMRKTYVFLLKSGLDKFSFRLCSLVRSLKLKFLVSFIIIFFSISANAVSEYELLWGQDDRREVYQGDNSIKTAALSVVALVPWTSLQAKDNGYQLSNASTLREDNWCESEPFSQQTSAAICTGFYIGGNRVITAAHCVNNRRDSAKLADFAVVFSFARSGLNRSSEKEWFFPEDKVYPIQKISAFEQISAINIDWAVLQLGANKNKDFPSVPPITLSYSQPNPDDEIVLIGHPLGLPKKFSVGKRLRQNTQNSEVFRVAIDAYQGDSGAPIFVRRENKLQLVGLMAAGGADRKIVNNCRISATCSSENADSQRCAGEIVVPVTRFQQNMFAAQ